MGSWREYISAPITRREVVNDERVCLCFQDRPKGIYSLFEKGMRDSGGGEAIVFGHRRLSYAELGGLVERYAAALEALDVRPGSRVGALLGNCPEYVALIFAIARLGGILVPMNIRETGPELAFIIGDSGAEVIVAHEELVEALSAARAMPRVRHVISMAADGASQLDNVAGGRAIPPLANVAEDDAAAILYTSGTTGRPKGAILSHRNIIHSFLHYQTAMTVTSNDRSILAVPMSHVTGLIALVALTIGAGGTLIIMESFNANRFIALAVEERMTHTLIVPAMFNLCLLQPAITNADLSAWRVAGYGGAIMPQVTLEKIATYLPQLKLINCYGATETTSPAVLMPPVHAAERAHQVGLPVLCCDIMIMDANGNEVAIGDPGEIWIAGPMVVSGYWNNPAATQKEFVGGYWRSGDIGSIDDQGFVRVIDRLKDVINRGGYKIYASEVENLILDHPAVVEVAVVGVPCEVLGERVHAHLVVKEPISSDEIREFCAGHLADYKIPEKYHFVEALPRNANGKILKRSLR